MRGALFHALLSVLVRYAYLCIAVATYSSNGIGIRYEVAGQRERLRVQPRDPGEPREPAGGGALHPVHCTA